MRAKDWWSCCVVTLAQAPRRNRRDAKNAKAYATWMHRLCAHSSALLQQLFEGVINAEMWYLFSFEQRPASQLVVPLGGTQ